MFFLWFLWFFMAGRVQGWDSVCWGVLRIPLLENKKKVSCVLGFWFLRFTDSWFLGFRVSWLLGFKNSKKLWGLYKLFGQYYQISISCSLIDIDILPKLFNTLLDGSTAFCGAHLFEHDQHFGFPKMRFTNHFKWLGIFLDYLRSPGVSKEKNKCLLEERTRPKIQKL